MAKRLTLLVLLLFVLPATAYAATVKVRIEGKTRTLYGPTEVTVTSVGPNRVRVFPSTRTLTVAAYAVAGRTNRRSTSSVSRLATNPPSARGSGSGRRQVF